MADDQELLQLFDNHLISDFALPKSFFDLKITTSATAQQTVLATQSIISITCYYDDAPRVDRALLTFISSFSKGSTQ